MSAAIETVKRVGAQPSSGAAAPGIDGEQERQDRGGRHQHRAGEHRRGPDVFRSEREIGDVHDADDRQQERDRAQHEEHLQPPESARASPSASALRRTGPRTIHGSITSGVIDQRRRNQHRPSHALDPPARLPLGVGRCRRRTPSSRRSFSANTRVASGSASRRNSASDNRNQRHAPDRTTGFTSSRSPLTEMLPPDSSHSMNAIA